MSTKKTANIETSGTSTAGKSPSAPKRHSKFYFDNTLVVIQIEDTLFNVHKYQLIKSETFSNMFNLPKAENGEPVEGSSPEHPIVMEGVAASDFEALLTVLYATHFSTHQPAPEASLIIPSFRLANMWNFSDLRAYLLPLAEKVLGDVDKIVFAREFNIKDWLAPAHIHLCERTEPITTDEATKLGVHSLLMISHMREKRPRFNMTPGQWHCRSCTGLSHTGTATCFKCQSYDSPNYRISAESQLLTGAGANDAGTDSSLETEVKQWVENGCILK